MDTKKIVKIAVIAACAILVVVVAISSFTVVSAGHTGVVLTFGAVEDTVLDEGLHFKIPFIQRVVQMNNRTQKIETDGSASSKDLQIISYVVAVNYHVNNDSSATLYQNVGTDYGTVVIVPAIQESIKAVTAQYTAEELITKRQSVGDQIKTALSDKINQYGLTVDGIVGRSTWYRLQDAYYSTLNSLPDEYRSYSSLLYPGYTLTTGTSGNVVTQVQTFLRTIAQNNKAVPLITVDGVFGPATRSAVIAVQKLSGIPQNGVVGPLTWNAIVNLYNEYR